jgi:hypothetical protein
LKNIKKSFIGRKEKTAKEEELQLSSYQMSIEIGVIGLESREKEEHTRRRIDPSHWI